MAELSIDLDAEQLMRATTLTMTINLTNTRGLERRARLARWVLRPAAWLAGLILGVGRTSVEVETDE